MKKNPHHGSNFDDFLREEGILEAVEASAVKSVLAMELQQLIKKQRLSKTDLAARMATSRAAVDRVLDPDNQSVTLDTLYRAARAVGRELRISLVKA
jgi:predicted XRE-type DNA-binding protein